ncbi:hypothetical protein PsorP6_010052 [Peronosclerospora sorghi]|uniref:Uncharacterized protein n=1 Tax=Peronosclerospora sorghi TaxID=230839 RepID=A0ACC0VTF9_9STRA|nr:hypothetical protein PsorP6_010052 [Peronosclerospora sorghi]
MHGEATVMMREDRGRPISNMRKVVISTTFSLNHSTSSLSSPPSSSPAVSASSINDRSCGLTLPSSDKIKSTHR